MPRSIASRPTAWVVLYRTTNLVTGDISEWEVTRVHTGPQARQAAEDSIAATVSGASDMCTVGLDYTRRWVGTFIEEMTLHEYTRVACAEVRGAPESPTAPS